MNPCGVAEGSLLLTLSLAAYMDSRYRDVEPALWLSAARALAPLGILCALHLNPQRPLLALALSNAVAVALVLVLYAAGLLGGGDVFAIAAIATVTPAIPGSLLPPSVLSLLYGSLVPALLIPILCVLNVAKVRGRRRLARLARERGLATSLFICATSVLTTVGKAQERGWLYPSKWDLGEGYSIVERDPPELLAEIARERGLDSEVWATPGLPQVAFILAGYVVALLVGDKPLQWFLRVAAH
jgi:Flp pilus assembly protein protease CpaA